MLWESHETWRLASVYAKSLNPAKAGLVPKRVILVPTSYQRAGAVGHRSQRASSRTGGLQFTAIGYWVWRSAARSMQG